VTTELVEHRRPATTARLQGQNWHNARRARDDYEIRCVESSYSCRNMALPISGPVARVLRSIGLIVALLTVSTASLLPANRAWIVVSCPFTPLIAKALAGRILAGALAGTRNGADKFAG
jgi:hypothetical protein